MMLSKEVQMHREGIKTLQGVQLHCYENHQEAG